MNKHELIEAVSERTGETNTVVRLAIDQVLESIKVALSEGNAVTLVGFGKFYTSEQKARTGINPQTGKPIEVPAKTAIKFKPGTALKGAVNN